MDEIMQFGSEVIERIVDGFHRYTLMAPIHLNYVSDSLCQMIGCTANTLLNANGDGYAAFVAPRDLERYQSFLGGFVNTEKKDRLQYRLLDVYGRGMDVIDTMISWRDRNGVMQASSYLTDVTSIKMENEALHRLNDTVPCGILQYTCEENPRVTYVNEQLLRIFRIPHTSEGERQLEKCKENIYLMIPPEERDQFRRLLSKVHARDAMSAGEMTALRGDGSRVRLYGWVSRVVDESGREVFQSVCMDVTDRYDRKKRAEVERYLRALNQVYDIICELDFTKKTVRLLHATSPYEALPDMPPMAMDDALHYWMKEVLCEDKSRERMRVLLEEVSRREERAREELPQIEFSGHLFGKTQDYMGIFLKTGDMSCLFCCRRVSRQAESDRLKLENSALRSFAEKIQELVIRFTDGMLGFEIRGDLVRPLYISDNVCAFFGYSREEWLALMQVDTPITDFVARCHISDDAFQELIENGEAEFHYVDATTHEIRQIRAICITGVENARRNGHVILADITGKKALKKSSTPIVYIRTFGYFDVFVNEKPIAFRNEKAKELFALLVDRRGGFVTSGEALSLLWENESANSVTLARYRKVALRLKNTLEEYGIADVMETVDGKRRIVPQRVRCDLYEYLSGEKQYAGLFKGSYLQNYSWSEGTLAELSGV